MGRSTESDYWELDKGLKTYVRREEATVGERKRSLYPGDKDGRDMWVAMVDDERFKIVDPDSDALAKTSNNSYPRWLLHSCLCSILPGSSNGTGLAS